MDPLARYVRVEDKVWVILEELDSVWLQEMWDSDMATQQKLLDVIYMVYLLKTRPVYPWIYVYFENFVYFGDLVYVGDLMFLFLYGFVFVLDLYEIVFSKLNC